MASGVGGVDDHRQMGQLLEHRHRRDIQGVAGGRLEGADTPLAQQHPAVPLREDVLGAHQELLDGGRHPPLEQDRLVELAEHLEQGEVLHVAGADLHDVGIAGHQLYVPRVDHLGDDGQAGRLPGQGQQLQPILFHPLEGIGAGARLEGPAPQHRRSGRLHGMSGLEYLRLALHRTGAGHHHQVRAADAQPRRQLHHARLRLDLAAGQLVGFEDRHHALHPRQRLQGVQHGLAPLVADGADDVAGLPVDDMGLVAQLLDPLLDLGQRLLAGSLLHDDDHCPALLCAAMWVGPAANE